MVLGIALLVGALYTLPNFFGEAPAVQISAAKASAKIDLGLQERVESALKTAGLTPELLALEGSSLKVRAPLRTRSLKHSMIVAIMSAFASPASVVRGPLPIHRDILLRAASLSHR